MYSRSPTPTNKRRIIAHRRQVHRRCKVTRVGEVNAPPPKGYSWRMWMSRAYTAHGKRGRRLPYGGETCVARRRFRTLLPPSQQADEIHCHRRQDGLEVGFPSPTTLNVSQFVAGRRGW